LRIRFTPAPPTILPHQPAAAGGKAQFGGHASRDGGLALEAYGAAHNPQEMLTSSPTIVTGRAKTYEAIVKNENISSRACLESFKVSSWSFRSLDWPVEVLSRKRTDPAEKSTEPAPVLPDSNWKQVMSLTHSEVIEEMLEVNDFDAVRIPWLHRKQIRSWSYGEVTKRRPSTTAP